MHPRAEVWRPHRRERATAVFGLYSDAPYHLAVLYAQETHLERRNFVGEKPLQLQIYRLGQLEKSIQSLSQIHVGVFGDILQGQPEEVGRPG